MRKIPLKSLMTKWLAQHIVLNRWKNSKCEDNSLNLPSHSCRNFSKRQRRQKNLLHFYSVLRFQDSARIISRDELKLSIQATQSLSRLYQWDQFFGGSITYWGLASMERYDLICKRDKLNKDMVQLQVNQAWLMKIGRMNEIA